MKVRFRGQNVRRAWGARSVSSETERGDMRSLCWRGSAWIHNEVYLGIFDCNE